MHRCPAAPKAAPTTKALVHGTPCPSAHAIVNYRQHAYSGIVAHTCERAHGHTRVGILQNHSVVLCAKVCLHALAV